MLLRQVIEPEEESGDKTGDDPMHERRDVVPVGRHGKRQASLDDMLDWADTFSLGPIPRSSLRFGWEVARVFCPVREGIAGPETRGTTAAMNEGWPEGFDQKPGACSEDLYSQLLVFLILP